jgi:hypothetical protein
MTGSEDDGANQTGSMGVISAASARHPRPSNLMMGIPARLHKAIRGRSGAAAAVRSSIRGPMTQQPRARDPDRHHHRCTNENAGLRPAMSKTIAVDHRADGLAKIEEG